MFRLLLIAALIPFSLLSAKAMLDHGYWGIIAFHFTSTAGMQVIFDLVLACLIGSRWMYLDAVKSGRNPWPYLVATVFLGSFGLLSYLLVGEFAKESDDKAVLA